MNIYKRIKLPYNLNGLEPIIFFNTMHYHYSVLHRNYELKLNETLKGTEIEKEYSSLEKLMENLDNLPEELKNDIGFFGGGLINHNFFFANLTEMSKSSEEIISEELMEIIKKNFTNLANLKKNLVKNALKIRGSGWTWLVLDKNNNLAIINTINQDGPWSLHLRPLIAIDVWEHAYFLDYGVNRKEYVEKLLNYLLNWKYTCRLYFQYINN